MSFREVERFFGNPYRHIVTRLATIPTNDPIEKIVERFLQKTSLETREGQDRTDGRDDGKTLSINSREAIVLTVRIQERRNTRGRGNTQT